MARSAGVERWDERSDLPRLVFRGLSEGWQRAQCLGMMNSPELPSVPSDRLAPVIDQLRLAVAAYLARFKGSSRVHTESDLRCYLAWCTGRGLDPLAARRPTWSCISGECRRSASSGPRQCRGACRWWVTAVGPLLGAQVGELLRLRGRWSSHPRYGRQFEVHSDATVLPATAAGIQKYLGSGLIKGIGPVMAERMVAHFGVDIMHVIEDEPGRLIEVDGLGPKRTAMIAAAWAEQEAIKEVMVFLQGVGVSTSDGNAWPTPQTSFPTLPM